MRLPLLPLPYGVQYPIATAGRSRCRIIIAAVLHFMITTISDSYSLYKLLPEIIFEGGRIDVKWPFLVSYDGLRKDKYNAQLERRAEITKCFGQRLSCNFCPFENVTTLNRFFSLVPKLAPPFYCDSNFRHDRILINHPLTERTITQIPSSSE